MSAPAVAEASRPSLRIRGAAYPIVLPSLRDPRLHLAAVIVTLQVLGQVAFDFDLSIAQILVSLGTCAVIEIAIAFHRRHVILWPASALLTGNGVAFVLRVPGTEHGDWWSLNGAWIFAGTAATALLSKYVIRIRGHHVFNPSNFGLVLCFLALGSSRAEPLDFWWGPLTPSLALAIAVIVAGGLAILRRLALLGIAIGFWVSFVVGIGALAASGHAMTARWHVGPVADGTFWWILAFSPEVLVFLFFMITDPKTVPAGPRARVAYGVAVGLLATLLIAPQTTEFASKVALLGALTIVCAARALWQLAGDRAVAAERTALTLTSLRGGGRGRRALAGGWLLVGAAGFLALLVVAGSPARPDEAVAAASPPRPSAELAVSVADTRGVAAIDRATALRIARDAVAAVRLEADALRTRDANAAGRAADRARLAGLWQQIRSHGSEPLQVPEYAISSVEIALRRNTGQGPPRIMATLRGTMSLATYEPGATAPVTRGEPTRTARTVELALVGQRYLIVGPRNDPGAGGTASSPGTRTQVAGGALGGVTLTDVAREVGLDFRNGAFRFGVAGDPAAMMGGGVCWLDYDRDGWTDLFLVNTHRADDVSLWDERGGLPRSALYRNVGGHFVDVSRSAGVDLPVRGTGCVAGDLNGDGNTDLYVTAAGYDVETDGYDALLWNDGDGTFTMGARAAGITAPGWHAGAAVGDVNGDGLADLFVAGYTDVNAPSPDSARGFPNDHLGVADHLYLNQGLDGDGHATFRDVSRQAGVFRAEPEHGLGAVFTDVDGDGRLDLYVANDGDPNRLYLNVARPGPAADDPAGLGFRLVEHGVQMGVADANAGMGIATADYTGDGLADLFVTNSRRQLHAAYGSDVSGGGFSDERRVFAPALGAEPTGWGAAFVDLDLDGLLDLVVANGAIPVRHPAADAEPLDVLRNVGDGNGRPVFANADAALGRRGGPRLNGRGLATADFDNDGDPDIAVATAGGRVVLLRNDGAPGHWLEVALADPQPGTVVTAALADGRTLVRELQAGGSYLSSSDARALFGLGDATVVRDLRVRRPDGSSSHLTDVHADRIVTLP